MNPGHACYSRQSRPGLRYILFSLVLLFLTALPSSADEHSDADAFLSDAETEQLRQDLLVWDRFMVLLVKQLASVIPVGDSTRDDLFGIFLDVRYYSIELMSSGISAGTDPMRELMEFSWEKLNPVFESVAEYIPDLFDLPLWVFGSAADLMKEFTLLGIGWQAEGLRQFAEFFAPGGLGSLNENAVDQELREIFGFGPSIPAPGSDFDFEDEPDANTNEDSRHNPERLRLRFFGAHLAHAAPHAELRRLHRWAPERDEMDEYLPLTHRLLNLIARERIRLSQVEPKHRELFRRLLLSTAWQETCWRQFKRTSKGVVPMRSPAGAIGMMQIIPRVWRGFYDEKGLAGDVFYNARAGGEILHHYLTRYALRHREHEQAGGLDNLARATYASYNGGPKKLTRYRAKNAPARAKKVDREFFEKYLAIKQGDELAVAGCF